MALLAMAIGALIPVMVTSSLDVPSWSLRQSLLPIIAVVGLWQLVALYRTELRRSALVATAFGAWCVVSALASPVPSVAIWGLYGIGTGLVFVLALIGAWAIGACVGHRGRTLVQDALLFGVLANSALAVIQMVIPNGPGVLGLFQGRSDGFMGNPVYLAELLAGGWWLVASRFAAKPALWAIPAIAVAAGLQDSGSRFGLIVLALAVIVGFVAFRRRIALALLGLAVVGTLAGTGLAHLNGGTTSSARVGTDSGVTARIDSWLSARHSVARRPILGEGPGTYLAATAPYHPLGMARTEGPDKLFGGAHNILVEYTVTTGIPGILLLLAWFILILRRSGWRDPLAGFALGMLAVHLAEPQLVFTTPLAFLALGGAVALRTPPDPVVPRPARAILGAGAVAATVVLIVGSVQYKNARLSESVAQAKSAIGLMPAWYQPRLQLAQDYLFLGDTRNDPSYRTLAVRAYLQAIAVDPAEPQLWIGLAGIESKLGHPTQAINYYRQALTKNPWSRLALESLVKVENQTGNTAAAHHFEAKALMLPHPSGDVASTPG